MGTIPRNLGLLLDAATQPTWRQLLNRPRRLIPPRLLAGRAPAAGEFRPLAGGLGITAAPLSGPTAPPEADGIFRALGRARPATDPQLWSRTDDGLLFLFELHGFAELARYAGGRRTAGGDAFWAAVLENWLAHCSSPGSPAWHPYPLSGRVLAWCGALSAGGWPPSLTAHLVESLGWQLQMLRRCVEHDIGGNHVLRNASALAVGGACCGDRSAWRRGQRVLARELPLQVLPDGGHEERSPSYARLILGDLEDVVEVERRAGRAPSAEILAAVARLGDALRSLTGPDGMLPRLNDAWDGPWFPRSPAAVAELPDTGYVTLRDGEDQVVLDVGPLCPPHLPPHAHADALSFQLWADGDPVVIDAGTGSYAPPDRAWARSTGSHATVAVDGQDQCTFWGPFRASQLPRVTRGVLQRRRDSVVLTAWHDGYRRLADPVLHVRTFCWLPGDGIVVVDRLRARDPHEVLSSLPLAPTGPGSIRIAALGGRRVSERMGRVAPVFGRYEPAPVLEQRASVAPAETFGWILTRSQAEVSVEGERVDVRRAGRPAVSFEAPL